MVNMLPENFSHTSISIHGKITSVTSAKTTTNGSEYTVLTIETTGGQVSFFDYDCGTLSYERGDTAADYSSDPRPPAEADYHADSQEAQQ